MNAIIRRSVEISRSPRVLQMLGLFDVPPAARSELTWDVSLDLPDEWSVGVIVGPSGCGKTTLARELFGDHLVSSWDWPADKSLLDGFPTAMGIKDIAGLLSSVGFSSPPAWVRPYHVLSNGQQFRVSLARTLAEMPSRAVIDEFTSVVDRTVAKIGSAAVAKAVRSRGQKLVAVTCHYDVLDWLEPDWIYQPETNSFEVADAARGSVRPGSPERLRRRPPIELEIVQADRSAWRLFKPHHYLSGELHKAARCFVGLVEGRPSAFASVLSFPHPSRPGWREHRTVCLPDFQGVGIGNALSEFVASLMAATGKPYRSTTSHPSMIRHRSRSAVWKMTRSPSMHARHTGATTGATATGMGRTGSCSRLTASFEYVGPAREAEARGFGIVDRPVEVPRLSRGLSTAIRRALAS